MGTRNSGVQNVSFYDLKYNISMFWYSCGILASIRNHREPPNCANWVKTGFRKKLFRFLNNFISSHANGITGGGAMGVPPE